MEPSRACVVVCHEFSDGENALAESRPSDVSHRAKITPAGFKKFLELRSVALSPRTWIYACEQPGELWIHNSSNRLNPDLANRCSVVSFARRTLTPSAVMR